jgi:hypothetical protein
MSETLSDFRILDFFTTDLHGITLKQGIHKMVLSVLFRGNSFVLYLLLAMRYALCSLPFFRLPNSHFRLQIDSHFRIQIASHLPNLSPSFICPLSSVICPLTSVT